MSDGLTEATKSVCQESLDFRKDLETLINKYCIENNSNTPDFILADYIIDCLDAFDKATFKRTKWYKK